MRSTIDKPLDSGEIPSNEAGLPGGIWSFLSPLQSIGAATGPRVDRKTIAFIREWLSYPPAGTHNLVHGIMLAGTHCSARIVTLARATSMHYVAAPIPSVLCGKSTFSPSHTSISSSFTISPLANSTTRSPPRRYFRAASSLCVIINTVYPFSVKCSSNSS